MSGHHPRCSPSLCRAALLASSLGGLACAARELDDGMDAEPIEHPPELIQRYEQACDDWCSLLDECSRDDITCDCAGREFSEEHDLCVEKAALRLECEAALTCGEIDLRTSDAPAQDRRCFSESIAEIGGCR